MKLINRFLKDEKGQDLVEYSLLLGFVALASAGLLISAGTSINSIWTAASTRLGAAATAGS